MQKRAINSEYNQFIGTSKGRKNTKIHVIADRAYGTQKIRTYIEKQKANYVIPPNKNVKSPWNVDWFLYKERHLVECFFHKLKQFRHISTRYDKLAVSFLSFIYIAAITILLK